jgi:tetratricopeptide (TPR) repeat protein
MPTKTRLLKIKLADIDPELLPDGASSRGASAYRDAVSQLLRKQMRQIGGLIESLAFNPDEVQVAWQPDRSGADPLDAIIEMLEQGQYRESILLLELLVSDDRDNPHLLYNLGMAYSDTSNLDRAVLLLRRLVSIAPDHVNGRIALGVALSRQKKYEEARVELERAAENDPNNAWAHRNLGGALLHLGRPEEAVGHLRKAAELKPDDERAWYGLGQALELAGDDEGADEAYRRVLRITEIGDVAELARQGLSKIADKTFRGAAPGQLRMAAVMYCLGALERFENMTPDEVQKVGLEIAVLGMNGLDVNDPTAKYRLRRLPGEFSGLQLVSIEYVAFKMVAPHMDIGFDLAQEYQMAVSLHDQPKAEE